MTKVNTEKNITVKYKISEETISTETILTRVEIS